MGKFAAKTDVTVSKTRDEIERTLERYGADQFIYGWQNDAAAIGFRMEGRLIRFTLPLPSRDDPAFCQYQQGSVTFRRTDGEIAKRYEQASRQRWRALLLVVKAKLEAVEVGISLFEDEFLANIVLPEGGTIGEWIRPQVAEAYRIGKMPTQLPMLPAPNPSPRGGG